MSEKRVEGERFENTFYPEDGCTMFHQAFIAYLRNYIPSLLYNGYRVFSGSKGGRGVTLTTHPHLVQRSWKSRAIPLLPLWTRVACYRVKPYLTLRKFFPSATTCPLRLRGLLPPGCGWSVTDFWGWDAQQARLRCPDENDGEMRGESEVPGEWP